MPASTGWTWLKEGIGLFRKQPAALTTLLFANILISAVISVVPVLNFVLGILIPSFAMAFMMACLMIENGERVTPAVLLTGFRQPALARLCKVGVIYLAVSLLLKLLSTLAVDPAVMQQLSTPSDPKTMRDVQIPVWDVLLAFGMGVLNIGTLVALSFAAPLTYWQQMSPGKAVFYSFFAVYRSARVFLVLLMSWFGILLLVFMVLMIALGGGKAALVGMVWMVFLFMLLLQCALYVAYRTIFGKPETAGAKPVDLSK